MSSSVSAKFFEKKIGSQTPTRTNYVDEGLSSIIDFNEADNVFKIFGINLFPWQKEILRRSLLLDDKNNFKYFNVGLSVPRQNGKTEILVARMIIGMVLLNEDLQYSSYRASSANAIFSRVLDILENCDKSGRVFFRELPTRKTNNKIIVCKDPKTGKKIGSVRFSTRGGGTGRGESFKVMLFDEAQDLNSAENASYQNTLASFKNAQAYYFGTPPSFEVASSRGTTSGVADGKFFTNLREEALAGRSKNTLWSEWSVSKIVSKTLPEYWYTCNPSLNLDMGRGRGLTERFFEGSTGTDENFCVENLGFWSSQDRLSLINIGRWRDQAIEDFVVRERFVENCKIAVSVKSALDDSSIAVVLASRNSDNEIFVEVLSVFSMEQRWRDECYNIVKPFLSNGSCKKIVIDGSSAQQAFKEMLARDGRWRENGNKFSQGKVKMASSQDVVKACSGLVNGIIEKTIFHLDDENVDELIQDLGKRSFKTSGYGFLSISGKTEAFIAEAIALAAESTQVVREISMSDIYNNNNNNSNNRVKNNYISLGGNVRRLGGGNRDGLFN